MPYNSADELKLFKQITLAICGDYHRGRNVKDQSRRIIEQSAVTYPPLDKQNVNTLLIAGRKSFDSLVKGPAHFIYLKPIMDHSWLVPIMAFKYHIEDDTVEASIRLTLMMEVDGLLKAIGYRYETGKGKHDYCHVQHIREFDTSRPIPTEKWIPEGSPAIPVDAGGPVGLLICVLGSLYGLEYVTQLTGQVDLQKVKLSIEQMRRRSCFHHNSGEGV